MGNIPIKLDFNHQILPNQIVKIRRGDGNVQSLDVTITSNGEQVDLSTYSKGQFRGTNSALQFVEKDIELSKDGNFTFKFPQNASSVIGNFKRAYFVFSNDQGQISTNDFPIYVIDYSDTDAEQADSLVDEYNKFVDELQKISDNFKTASDELINAFKNDANNELKAINDKYLALEKQLKDSFNGQLEVFKTDYQAWKNSIETDISSLTSQLPGLETKINDIKSEIDSINFPELESRLEAVESALPAKASVVWVKSELDKKVDKTELESIIDARIQVALGNMIQVFTLQPTGSATGPAYMTVIDTGNRKFISIEGISKFPKNPSTGLKYKIPDSKYFPTHNVGVTQTRNSIDASVTAVVMRVQPDGSVYVLGNTNDGVDAFFTASYTV